MNESHPDANQDSNDWEQAPRFPFKSDEKVGEPRDHQLGAIQTPAQNQSVSGAHQSRYQIQEAHRIANEAKSPKWPLIAVSVFALIIFAIFFSSAMNEWRERDLITDESKLTVVELFDGEISLSFPEGGEFLRETRAEKIRGTNITVSLTLEGRNYKNGHIGAGIKAHDDPNLDFATLSNDDQELMMDNAVRGAIHQSRANLFGSKEVKVYGATRAIYFWADAVDRETGVTMMLYGLAAFRGNKVYIVIVAGKEDEVSMKRGREICTSLHVISVE